MLTSIIARDESLASNANSYNAVGITGSGKHSRNATSTSTIELAAISSADEEGSLLLSRIVVSSALPVSRQRRM